MEFGRLNWDVGEGMRDKGFGARRKGLGVRSKK